MKYIFLLSIVFYLIPTQGQQKLRIEFEVEPYFETAKTNNVAFSVDSELSLFELTANEIESIYTIIPTINNSQTELNGISSAIMSADANPVYKNLKTERYTESIKLSGKTFLVQDDLPIINWEIKKETKDIIGFSTFKAIAVLKDENQTKIEAWYSPKLNYKIGPEKYWGLPGLILEVKTVIEYKDGTIEGTHYIARKLEVIKDNKKINPPQKGKEITLKEYKEEHRLYMDRLMNLHGGGVDTD